ncbi:helix-turn-helix domain-containing protein [Pseudomonas aeruginosa]
MNVGQAIRLCRTQRGVSQSTIANRANCSVSYLSMLENNKREPTFDGYKNCQAHCMCLSACCSFWLPTKANWVR